MNRIDRLSVSLQAISVRKVALRRHVDVTALIIAHFFAD